MLSVVTPSFNQLNWLKLCATSIANQEDAEYEHIAQDAGTGIGLVVQKKLQMMRAGFTASVFTDTGENLCPDPLPERDCTVDFAHA